MYVNMNNVQTGSPNQIISTLRRRISALIRDHVDFKIGITALFITAAAGCGSGFATPTATPYPTHTPLPTHTPAPTYTPVPQTHVPDWLYDAVIEEVDIFIENRQSVLPANIALQLSGRGFPAHASDISYTVGDTTHVFSLNTGVAMAVTDFHASYRSPYGQILPFRCRFVTLLDDHDNALIPTGSINGSAFCADPK